MLMPLPPTTPPRHSPIDLPGWLQATFWVTCCGILFTLITAVLAFGWICRPEMGLWSARIATLAGTPRAAQGVHWHPPRRMSGLTHAWWLRTALQS